MFIYNQSKSASIYHTNKQKRYGNIVIRKKLKETAEGKVWTANEVYEWRSNVTSAFNENRWYPIRRENIVCITDFENAKKLLHWRYVREFFNWLLKGETVQLSGHYCRLMKTLCVDVQNIQLHNEVKNR